MKLLVFALVLPFILAALGSVAPIFVPNVLVSGEPGSGKSVGTAHLALSLPRPTAVFSGDPAERSTTLLLLEHAPPGVPVLYHDVGNESYPLSYGLLTPAPMSLPKEKRRKLNLREAKQFAEIEMSRRGGSIASTPLMEEYTLAKNMLFLCQHPWKDPSIVPYAFRPQSAQFKALLRDCWDEETRDKFDLISGMTPRALRAECGSAVRLCDGNFRNEEFLAACRHNPNFDLGAFLQSGGWLLLERGKADRDVTTVIIRAVVRKIAEHTESRPEPRPPVVCILDECTNVGTAKEAEQRYAAEDRKYGGPHMWFIVQYPNFFDPDLFFQVCQEFHAYACADEGYARKQAKKIAAKLGDFSLVDQIASDLLNFKPGWRYVVGRGGVRREKVPMLHSPYPDWPGLREAKLQEKIQCIYTRPEYRTPPPPPPGSPPATPAAPGPKSGPSPSPSLPGSSSPVDRLKNKKRPRSGPGSGS